VFWVMLMSIMKSQMGLQGRGRVCSCEEEGEGLGLGREPYVVHALTHSLSAPLT
jgi:hypothetical protein